MRSLKRRFKNIAIRNPYWSSYICFYKAVSNQKFSKQTIHRWFYKLVSKNDYNKNEVKLIMSQLKEVTKTL
jgi:hypothetical protein